MATMNISGMTLVEDPSYRYKMPRILAKVEGRGNGIKTVLVNVNDVANSLTREASEITKFFGCELGSQTTFSAETDRAIVNGAHTAQDLQTHLCRYIENFVLCQNCRLPETHYKIKAGAISQKCLACGHKSAVDMTHKLTTFILAQHKKAKETAAKAEKGGEKKKKDKKDGTAVEEKPAAVAVEMTDAQATAAKADKKAKKDKLKEAAGGGKKTKKSGSTDDLSFLAFLSAFAAVACASVISTATAAGFSSTAVPSFLSFFFFSPPFSAFAAVSFAFLCCARMNVVSLCVISTALLWPHARHFCEMAPALIL